MPKLPSSAIFIAEDDPLRPDVADLLATHLGFSRSATPAEFSFALGPESLSEAAVSFFSARRDGELLGVGALKDLGDGTAEIKSMHTRQVARGQGVGRAMVVHLLAEARRRGYRLVRLETGTTDDFAPARALYESLGFVACDAYGNYVPSPHNTFMELPLERAAGPTL